MSRKKIYLLEFVLPILNSAFVDGKSGKINKHREEIQTNKKTVVAQKLG